MSADDTRKDEERVEINDLPDQTAEREEDVKGGRAVKGSGAAAARSPSAAGGAASDRLASLEGGDALA